MNAGSSFFGGNLQPFGCSPSGEPELRLNIHLPSPDDAPRPDRPHSVAYGDAESFRYLRRQGELQATQAFGDCVLDLDPASELPFNGQPWLMLALWGYLAHREGLFLHGAVCEFGGKFFLLLGAQQVGKSTLGRLVVAAGGACLTDEYPFVTRNEDCFVAHGTPWPGLQGQPSARSAPLSAVFFLRHAPHNALMPLGHKAAALRLLANHRFFTWCPETIPDAVERIDALAAAVPVFDLGFVPTLAAVECLLEAL